MGEPADAREFLVALINESEPISQLFQGQMSSTVKCSICERSTIKTDNTQDISLQIDEDANLSLEDSLHDFFQSETLEGENAYWCDTCERTCQVTKTLSYTRTPTILINHLKRLILGKKMQTHISFDTTLGLESYMAPSPTQPYNMDLIDIISHHGTKDNGHYTTMTRRDDKWTLYDDAIVTQTPMSHIHQTQAYILMYRKADPRPEPRESVPKDIPKKHENRLRAKKDLNPGPRKKQNREIPDPQPDLLIQSPSGQNLRRQVHRDSGTNSAPRAEIPTEIQGPPDTALNAHVTTPPDPKANSIEDGGGGMEGSGENTTSTTRENEKEHPLQPEEQLRQPPEEPTTLLQSIPIFFQLSQGHVEDLTGLLSELSGTLITTGMTCKWLDLEPQTKEIPYDSRTNDLLSGTLIRPPKNGLTPKLPSEVAQCL